MGTSVKSYFRSMQTFVPGLQNARFKLERRLRQVLKSVHDPDWQGFRLLMVGDGVLLDIGANRGQSIDSFRTVLPGRIVVAFEPNLWLARMLSDEYRGCDDVRIEATALSDRIGEQKLYLPRYRNWIFDGLASMDKTEAMDWLNRDRLKGFDPQRLTCLEMDISVRKLDDFELRPSVIKLDTQGSEEQVLLGGRLTIERARPVVLLESATSSIARFLGQFDYRPYIFDGQQMIPDRLDGKNVFFVTSNHVSRPI